MRNLLAVGSLVLVLALAGCRSHYSQAECEKVVDASESVLKVLTESSSPLSAQEREAAMQRCLKDERRDAKFIKCLKQGNGSANDAAQCIGEHNKRH